MIHRGFRIGRAAIRWSGTSMDRTKAEIFLKKFFIYVLHTTVIVIVVALLVGVALEIFKRL